MVERSLPNFEMSAPDTKALPPARVSPTTRISLSAAKPLSMLVVASHISSDTALCRSGLLKVTMPTPPSLRESILSVWVIVSSFVSSSASCAKVPGALHRAGLMQCRDLAGRKSELLEHRVGVLAKLRGRRHE